MGNEDITNNQLLQILNKNLEEKFDILVNKLDQARSEIENANKVINSLKQENTLLRTRVEILENKFRKNNIAIFGFHPNNDSLLDNTIKLFNEKLELSLNPSNINNIFQSKYNANVPVIVEFNSYLTKTEVYKNIHKLKNSGIFINNDMSKEDRKIHKILREKLKEAKDKSQKAKIIGNKILIDGIKYDYTDIVNEETGKQNDVMTISDADEQKRGVEGHSNTINPGKKVAGTANVDVPKNTRSRRNVIK